MYCQITFSKLNRNHQDTLATTASTAGLDTGADAETVPLVQVEEAHKDFDVTTQIQLQVSVKKLCLFYWFGFEIKCSRMNSS